MLRLCFPLLIYIYNYYAYYIFNIASMNTRLVPKNKFSKITINAQKDNTISKRILYNNIVNKYPTQYAKFRKEKPKSYSLYTNGGVHKTLINKTNNIQRDFTFNKDIFAFNHNKTISNRTHYKNNEGIILSTLSSTINDTFRRNKKTEIITLKKSLNLPKPSVTNIIKKSSKDKFIAYNPIHNNIKYEQPLILPINLLGSLYEGKINNTHDDSNEKKILNKNKALYQLNSIIDSEVANDDDFYKDNYMVKNNSESEEDSMGVLSFDEVKDIISYNKMEKIQKEDKEIFTKNDYSKFITKGKKNYLTFFNFEEKDSINDKSPSTNASSKTNKHYVSMIS